MRVTVTSCLYGLMKCRNQDLYVDKSILSILSTQTYIFELIGIKKKIDKINNIPQDPYGHPQDPYIISWNQSTIIDIYVVIT